MLPVGWETAAKLVAGMPSKISASEWIAMVDATPRPEGLPEKQFNDCLKLVKQGCVTVNPMLLLRNHDDSFGLSGVNCAYVRAAQTAEDTLKKIDRLLAKGVRAFSIYVSALSSPISVLFSKLEVLAKEAPKRGPMPVFAVWAELHSKRLLEYIAEVSEADGLRFTNRHSPASSTHTHPTSGDKSNGIEEPKQSCTTLGVLVPKVFFELVAQQHYWHFHEGVASAQLSVAHGSAYSKKYEQLRGKAEGACAMRAQKVLTLLVRAAVSHRAKHVLLLRDACHSLRATSSGASTIWNESVNDAPIFPNHMAEVPLVCAADVTLQFAAFVNVERTRFLRKDDGDCCRAAYAFLDAILYSHIVAAQTHVQGGEVLALSSAVGLIGVHDSLTHLNHSSITSDDKNYGLDKDHRRRSPSKQRNKSAGRRSSATNSSGESSIGSDKETSIDDFVSRPLSAADVEMLVVPLVRAGHAVFPMSGTLASILWRVSPGSWTCQQPYWMYANSAGDRVVVPSGGFSRFCEEKAVSLDHEDSVRAAAEKYAARLSRALHGRILSTRVEAQIHEMRKLCSSFFSTTSMPLTLSHEDSHEFRSAAALLLFLAEVVIKNANNDCPVLLPEVRTSVTDASIAILRRRMSTAPGAMKKLWATCIKRRRTGEISSAVEELDRFFEEVVDRLRDLRNAAQKPLPLYALQVFQTLVSQKVEEV